MKRNMFTAYGPTRWTSTAIPSGRGGERHSVDGGSAKGLDTFLVSADTLIEARTYRQVLLNGRLFPFAIRQDGGDVYLLAYALPGHAANLELKVYSFNNWSSSSHDFVEAVWWKEETIPGGVEMGWLGEEEFFSIWLEDGKKYPVCCGTIWSIGNVRDGIIRWTTHTTGVPDSVNGKVIEFHRDGELLYKHRRRPNDLFDDLL